MTSTTTGRSGRDWRRHAACLDADPELFQPAGDSGPVFDRQARKAKAVCAGCRVRSECLTFALELLPHGIAGGLTASERAVLRQRESTSTTSTVGAA